MAKAPANNAAQRVRKKVRGEAESPATAGPEAALGRAPVEELGHLIALP